MSGVSLVFDFPADDALRRHLQRLAALDAGGFDAARREIGEYMLGEVQDALDGQELYDGSPMPQSAAAIARRGKTLIDKHHLHDSYVYQLVDGADRGVAVGSNSAYARIHHFGGEAGRGHKTILPPRPVLGMTPDREREIGDILMSAVRATAGGA